MFCVLQRRTFASVSGKFNDVVIVSVARTPVGTMQGGLASLSAPKLGAIALKAAIERAGIQPGDVEELYLGNVVSANLGQAPARQALIAAGSVPFLLLFASFFILLLGSLLTLIHLHTTQGIPNTTECTTINKVCASGMKTITLAAKSIMLGHRDIMMAGGMESMSNVPYYLEKARQGYNLGHGTITDGIIKDGLWDVYYNQHMGNCTEEVVAKYNITREEQDAFAVGSYKKSAAAVKVSFPIPFSLFPFCSSTQSTNHKQIGRRLQW